MRIFFKGLSELRGIAALGVVWHHIDLYKHRNGAASLFDGPFGPFIETLGKHGVYLFFVLSGFLITYLLLSEMKFTGGVKMGKFYLRRILRIWPLYYFIVLLSFFILPVVSNYFSLGTGSYYGMLMSHGGENFGGKLMLFLLFLPNLALILFTPVAGASQSWSVGVEEQFYLLWPQLLVRFKNHILALLISVIVLKFALLFGFTAINMKFKHVAFKTVLSFLKSFNIELMALGGIGAYCLMHGKLETLYTRLPRFAPWVVLILIGLLLWHPVNYFILGGLFLVLILLNIHDGHAVLRSRVFAFLGDISYGVYMYHPIVMFMVFSLADSFLPAGNSLFTNVVIYVAIIGITILISFLSFRYLEAYFLRWKDRFVVVPSGKPVHE